MMGWHTAAALEEPYVCARPCQHTDCAERRRVAAARCRHCDAPIGPGAKYFLEPPDESPVHAACVWAREEKAG
jgi:hypothetical protein